MKTIAFLLGAGCEGNGQLGLPSGKSFKRDTIRAEDAKRLNEKINRDKSFAIVDGPFIKHNSTSVLYQTIKENPGFENQFDEPHKTIIGDYLEYKNGSTSFDDEKRKQIQDAFRNLYKSQFYEPILDQSKKDDALDEKTKFFLENACFYSFADSQFNFLRRLDLYEKEIRGVIKLYYSAFGSILRGLDKGNKVNAFLNDNMPVMEARKRLASLIDSLQADVLASHRDSGSLYYNIIQRFINEHSEYEVGAITTNYTNFVEKMIGIESNNISYVHGRLDLFEELRTKKVAGITEFAENNFIFPFIFVQSGVKPIVTGGQIHEMEKAAKMIETSDLLVILGYGINSDDEHITNLIRERLRRRKRTVCFVHGEKREEKEMKMRNALIDSVGIEFRSTGDFELFLDSFDMEGGL